MHGIVAQAHAAIHTKAKITLILKNTESFFITLIAAKMIVTIIIAIALAFKLTDLALIWKLNHILTNIVNGRKNERGK